MPPTTGGVKGADRVDQAPRCPVNGKKTAESAFLWIRPPRGKHRVPEVRPFRPRSFKPSEQKICFTLTKVLNQFAKRPGIIDVAFEDPQRRVIRISLGKPKDRHVGIAWN